MNICKELYKNTQSRYLESFVETSPRDALVELQTLKALTRKKGKKNQESEDK